MASRRRFTPQVHPRWTGVSSFDEMVTVSLALRHVHFHTEFDTQPGTADALLGDYSLSLSPTQTCPSSDRLRETLSNLTKLRLRGQVCRDSCTDFSGSWCSSRWSAVRVVWRLFVSPGNSERSGARCCTPTISRTPTSTECSSAGGVADEGEEVQRPWRQLNVRDSNFRRVPIPESEPPTAARSDSQRPRPPNASRKQNPATFRAASW